MTEIKAEVQIHLEKFPQDQEIMKDFLEAMDIIPGVKKVFALSCKNSLLIVPIINGDDENMLVKVWEAENNLRLKYQDNLITFREIEQKLYDNRDNKGVPKEASLVFKRNLNI
jgi:hypothetical protein